MNAITDADREAARILREALADISGFWHLPGDDSPIVAALARHRSEAEQRLADKLAPFIKNAPDCPPKAPNRPPVKGKQATGRSASI